MNIIWYDLSKSRMEQNQIKDISALKKSVRLVNKIYDREVYMKNHLNVKSILKILNIQ